MPSLRWSFLAASAERLRAAWQDVVDVPEGVVLRLALGEPVAELLNGAGVAVFAFDEKGLEINHLIHG